MKLVICIGLVMTLLCVTARHLHAAASTPVDADIKSLLRDRVAQPNHGTCLVAGVIDATGSKVVSYGNLSESNPRAADGDTVFEIGSATKVFTGLLLADAAQRGEVALDDPVSKFLPQSAKTPSRNGRQITLLDLATHTSGLPRLPDNLAPSDPANPYADYTPEKLYQFLSGYKLPREIGSKFEYSNLGVGLLGHALALRAATGYEDLLVGRIAAPLGMNATRISLSPDLKSRLAQGHGVDGQPAANWDMATLAGAGGVRSTANDLLKFVAANLGVNKSPLWPAMQLSQKPHHDAGSPNMDVALCWHIAKSPNGNVVWHNGETGGYHSFIAFDPATKRGVVVLSNAAASIDDLGFHILDTRNPLAQPPKQPAVVKLSAEVLDYYVGRYELAPGIIFSIARDGDQLKAQLTGQGYNPIFPESETRFFYKVVDAQLSFVKDDHGKVTRLILHQNGVDQSANKISDEPPVERRAIKLDAKLYDAVAGEYQLAPGAVFTIRRDGDRLLAQLSGQPVIEIFPESETEFFYKVVDAQIMFVKNPQGKVTALVLHQHGQNMEAKRKE
jgi:CubicO group peptidase (beta-lactamase class C family)